MWNECSRLGSRMQPWVTSVASLGVLLQKTSYCAAAVIWGFAGRGTARVLPRDRHTPSVVGTVPYRGIASWGDGSGIDSVSNSSPDLDAPHWYSRKRQTHASLFWSPALSRCLSIRNRCHSPILFLKKWLHVGDISGSKASFAALKISREDPNQMKSPFLMRKLDAVCYQCACKLMKPLYNTVARNSFKLQNQSKAKTKPNNPLQAQKVPVQKRL